ncbi:fluoride efflux transporter CrcB [Uruburuella testudinis]|uniref:Fluoride-specific ion channel FluC n=1 Tax=Uruburuella testudinis TaxID=1282863 RepID=A0ABY4DQ53_9NEIS|nr:fluoride efflux transporter CrcB [Uruburuella testudinis]UOO81011.1 fluoride efflux transporter CrcB [Uruburuella testudinis]
MLTHIIMIAAGAAIGAVLRWALGLWLASASSSMALGTLAANWLGAYLIGIAAALVMHTEMLPSHWRLLVITGFLGSLTTFSGFSLEVVGMLQAQRWGAALATISLHLLGSLLLTAAGMFTVAFWRA